MYKGKHTNVFSRVVLSSWSNWPMIPASVVPKRVQGSRGNEEHVVMPRYPVRILLGRYANEAVLLIQF